MIKAKAMKNIFWASLVILLGLALIACRPRVETGKLEASPQPAARSSANDGGWQQSGVKTEIGFRSKKNLVEHYEKHGREFGDISRDEYLRQAQNLRDAPSGGDILETRRVDGITTRYNRVTGDFIAFNEDLTIRTFFRPNDGERYFKRQINREH